MTNLDQGVIESMKAIETLIKGTTLMFKGKKGRLFEKKGDYSLAIKDFERVGPRNVYKGDKYWVSDLHNGITLHQTDIQCQ